MSWLKGSVFTAASLPVVGVSHDHPRDVLGLVVAGRSWDISKLSSELVPHLVHGHVEGIGGTACVGKEEGGGGKRGEGTGKRGEGEGEGGRKGSVGERLVHKDSIIIIIIMQAHTY